MWVRIRFGLGLLLLLMFASMVLGAVLNAVEGTSDWVLILVVGALLFGLPGFLLAFWRQAKLVPWWGVTGIIVGLSLMYFGYAAWQSDESFLENAAEVTAVMAADAEEHCNTTSEGIASSCWWRGPFSYEVDGVEYSGIGATPPQAVAGDRFLIRYHVEDPSEWRVIDFESTMIGGLETPSGDWPYWIPPIFGVAFLVAGVIGFRYQIRERIKGERASTEIGQD